MQKCYTKLKERGIALTSQRAYILKSMQTRTDHPDVEAVYTSMRTDLPAISLDTVYRTLHLFANEGLVKILAVPTHRFRFEGRLHEHDHFLCTQCETISDVDCSDLPRLSTPAAVQAFGEVYAQQRVYLGICHTCAAKKVPSDGAKRGKSASKGAASV